MKLWQKIVGMFGIAFLIRLIGLDQSLWLDEATSAQVAKIYSFGDIITKFSPADFHPPLYYLTLKLWTFIGGTSEIWLRMLSVMCSLLAGYFVYLIGRKIKNESTGLWAAAYFLFNPLIIYYSQEARMYMMVTALLTGLTYFTLAYPKNKYSLIAIPVLSLLSIFTFYGSLLYIVTLGMLLVLRRKWALALGVGATLVTGLIIVSPLLFQQLNHAHIMLAQVKNWSLVLGKAELKNVLMFPMKFTSGRISFTPKALYYALSFGWITVLLWPIVKGARKQLFLLGVFLLPIVLGYVLSFFTPMMQYFRFQYVIPMLALLLTCGVSGKLYRSILLGGFLMWSGVYLFVPAFHREDWKALSRILPSSIPTYMVLSSSDPLKYYHTEARLRELSSLEHVSLSSELAVIPYTADIHGINYSKILTDKGYVKSKIVSVRQLSYEVWENSNKTQVGKSESGLPGSISYINEGSSGHRDTFLQPLDSINSK
ncbi:hypothetical protein HGA88_04590 [Candidatus Roizmanbacteria bacterium]|nr:hypothetical protein [Candidatus Roizmanbacteria bacterium]